ncbi:flagellar protein FlaG [Paenibacillus sp. MMS18-CY102]|uniref:flagellar protein FlaG n=1 Tax=Paenibacillus sp. MMS18-CY102 TaxID=2682849 RepID=UPI001365B963|nr:flagellar protein FlaG [Paenibacillus sp. MMS18-CY102]MWC30912.1 flagellar biosynthesis protein FlaG [Paenibacillus sp. MMS18-CY102]
MNISSSASNYPAQKSVPSNTGESYIRVSGEYGHLKEKQKHEILSVSEKALMSAIDKANRAVQGTPHEFNYKIHQPTGQVIVQILNSDTHEIVHECPSEKFIELVEKLQELSVGAIIDEKR